MATHSTRRRFIRVVGGGGLLVGATGVASAQQDQPRHYLAYLTGANQLPPVETGAKGLAGFKLSPDGEALHYTLAVANIEDVTMAHIHLGAADENGDVVAWLYPETGMEPQQVEGNFGGVLAKGTITEDDLVGPLAEESMDELIEAIEDGEAYVNVHTEANPGGEIRGQID